MLSTNAAVQRLHYVVTSGNVRYLEFKKTHCEILKKLIAQSSQLVLAMRSASHTDFVALATHVTNSISTCLKKRACLMTVWSLSSTMLKYFSQKHYVFLLC